MEARTEVCWECNGKGGRRTNDVWRRCTGCEGRGQRIAAPPYVEPGLSQRDTENGGREWISRREVDKAIQSLQTAVDELTERVDRLVPPAEAEELFAFRRAKSEGEGTQ